LRGVDPTIDPSEHASGGQIKIGLKLPGHRMPHKELARRPERNERRTFGLA
jgi:hypothetical protein